MKRIIRLLVVLVLVGLFVSCSIDISESNLELLSPVPTTIPITKESMTESPIQIEEKPRFSYIVYEPVKDYEPCFSIDNALSENMLRYASNYSEITYYGYMDMNFNPLSLPISVEPSVFHNGLALVKDNAGSFVINKSIEELDVNPFSPFLYNDLWYSYSIENPRFETRINNKSYYYAYLDIEKYKDIDIETFLVPISYFDKNHIHNENELEHNHDLLWGYKTFKDAYIENIALEDKYIIPPIFSDAREFKEGLAAVRKGDKWGYIDMSGEVIIDFIFDAARDFKRGWASVGKETEDNDESLGKSYRWGLINTNGEYMVDCVYNNEIDFNFDLAIVRDENGSNIIDIAGKTLLPNSVQYIEIYENNRVLVWDTESYYFTDYIGQNINGILYEEARPFNEGLAAVFYKNSWGYIGEDGLIKIEPQYQYAGEFQNGIALVKLNNQTFLIDKSGKKYLEELELTAISYFNEDGYALAYKEKIVNEEKTRIYYIIHKEIG